MIHNFVPVCKGGQYFMVRLHDFAAVSDGIKPKAYDSAEHARSNAGADLGNHGVVPFARIPVCQSGKHTGSIMHPI